MIDIEKLDYNDVKFFFHYNLPMIATDKKEVNFIFEKIFNFVSNLQDIEDNSLNLSALLNRYLFENKLKIEEKVNNYFELFFGKDYKDEHILNLITPEIDFNILNILLTSPYITNKNKKELFYVLKKNDTFKDTDSNYTFFQQPLFLIENKNKTNEVYLEYHNFIEKISPTEFNFSLKTYNLNSYSNFILFNLKHNKDIESINNLMKTIIHTYTIIETTIDSPQDFKHNDTIKKISIFLLNIINEIYKDKFLSNSLNLENKSLSLSVIQNKILNKRKGDSKYNLKKIEANFYCHNKLEEINLLKGKDDVYIRNLLESKEAIEDEKIIKLILRNMELKTDLFNLNDFLNINNKTLTEVSDNYLLFHSKFINFLNNYQDIILNKNSDLYYFFNKNIHNIRNNKLNLNIRIAFENDFSNVDFFIEVIKYLKKTYTVPLFAELNNKDKELKDFVKKSLLNINYFIKNPHFMLSLFENNKNTYEELFYLINKNIKKHNLSIFSTSKESIKLNYENKNFNILKLENNNKNRTFLKSYIYNLFESDFISKFVIHNNKNENMYHSLTIFLINNFSHLNEKFPNLLKELIEEIEIENIIKENKSYIIEIIDNDILKDNSKTTEQKINDLATISNKEKYTDLFIKSIEYISENYIDLTDRENVENIIEIIKKKNKIALNF